MDNKKVKHAMFYFGLFCIVVGVISCLISNVAGGGVVIITGIALVLLGQFEIESIKMLGLEAKLRNTISEAEHVLDKLRKISLPFSEIAVSTAARAGRASGATPSKDMMLYVKVLETQLLEMGVSEHEISKIKQPWITTATFDLSSQLRNNLLKFYDRISDAEGESLSLVGDDQEKKDAILNKIKALGDEKKKVYDLLSLRESLLFINKYDEFINASYALSDQEKTSFSRENIELIDDINYLVDNGRIRRPENPDSFPNKNIY